MVAMTRAAMLRSYDAHADVGNKNNLDLKRIVTHLAPDAYPYTTESDMVHGIEIEFLELAFEEPLSTHTVVTSSMAARQAGLFA